MKKKGFVTKLVVAAMVGCLAACAGPAASETTGAAKNTTGQTGTETGVENTEGQSRTEKIITYAIPADIGSMDPREATNTNNTAVVSYVFSALVQTDCDYQITFDAAESYEIVDDSTYKFTLKKGIKFHDGEEMTSEDVKYSSDTLRREDATYRLKSDMSFIYIEIIDDYSFYLKTDSPNKSTLQRLSNLKILPKHYVEEVGDEAFAANPIGSGPYQYVSWKKDAYIEVEAFDDYFGGRSDIDRVVCKIIPEASSRIAALEAGEVDLITAVSTSQIDRLKNIETIDVASKGTTRVVYFTMNTLEEGSPMQDIKVRQALNYAVDNDLLIRGVLDNYASPIKTLALNFFDGYDDDVQGYEYNPEKARELLAEAGYPDGFQMELAGAFSSLSNGSDVAQAVAAQLTEVGLKVTVLEKDSDSVKEEYKAGTSSELTMTSFGGPNNNINFISRTVLGTGARYSAYSNAQLDELLDKVDTTIAAEESKKYYSELQHYMTDYAPVLPLYQSHAIYAYNNRLQNWEPRVDEMVILYGASVAD